MRRLLAIAIAVLIVLPAISPLFALGSDADPTRPICCRRDGKHHCMLVDMETVSSASSGTRVIAPAVSERCPYGSKLVSGNTYPDWSVQIADAIFAGIVSHPAIAPQTESKRRISADRSRQKRGPPAVTPA